MSINWEPESAESEVRPNMFKFLFLVVCAVVVYYEVLPLVAALKTVANVIH